MNIYRVDDRLIHGQVVENWLETFSINFIVVINDSVASDELRQNIMRFAVPENVCVLFVRVDEVSKIHFDKEKNYLFLFENLKDVERAVENGLKIDKLNLGGIHFMSGRNYTLGKVIFLSDDECNLLKKLLSMGIDIYRQSIPQESPVEVKEEI
ncbi:MAG: PTS sugar transporter subunit IIB [Elusimicrobiales bacterium]|nr:PTS sugar transporter subunit IIB [Elusimicrobiales bacterium]